MRVVTRSRLLACRLTLLGLAAASLIAVTTAEGTAATTEPQLVFVDDFTGSKVDTTRWVVGNTATNWSGIGSGSCHLASQVRVSGGILRLTSAVTQRPFTCRYPNGASFSTRGATGQISTGGKFSQTYGTWQIRARFPSGGSHGASALWLYPSKKTYGEWPRSGEIDIAERMPWSAKHAYASLHYLDSSGGTSFRATDGDGNPGETRPCSTDVTQWHVYGVTWERTQITFTIDGQVCSTMTWTPQNVSAPAPFDHPFHTILTQGAVIADTSVRVERETLVDWVKVWK